MSARRLLMCWLSLTMITDSPARELANAPIHPIHLLDSLDNIGEANAWCQAINPRCSENVHEVDCLACLQAFLSQAAQVAQRLVTLTSNRHHSH